MWGYATTSTSRENVEPATTASAEISCLPAVLDAGTVTTKGVDVLSPLAFSVNGASAGVDVHPCGRRSRIVPLTGCGEKLVTRTTRFCRFADGPSGTTSCSV